MLLYVNRFHSVIRQQSFRFFHFMRQIVLRVDTLCRRLLRFTGMILILMDVLFLFAPRSYAQRVRDSELAARERRVALVVGNSNYRNVARLVNPSNDARLVASTLRSLGFTMVGGREQNDLDKSHFDRAIENFGDQIRGADVALFYYAGHGIRERGSNYLVPVDANPTRESDVDFQLVNSETVLHQMEDAKTRLNLIILDACRNNPFGGRGLRALGGGLGQMQAPEGTLISYAAQPRAVATDGDGNNSPYSASLADAIREPGVDIVRAFNQVGLSVKQQTGGRQEPWLSISPLEGDFYFVKAAPTPVVAAVSTPTLEAPSWGGVPDADVVYWMSIPANTNNPEFLKSYLKQFPNGRFADLAKLRLKTSQEAVIAPPRPLAPPAAAESMSPSRAPTTETFTATTKAPINREETQILRHDLLKSGYKPHVMPTQVGEATEYHIEIGPFLTEAQLNSAQKTLDELEARTQLAMHFASPQSATVQSLPSVAQPEPRPTIAEQAHPAGSLQQQRSDSLPPMAVTTIPDASQLRETEQGRGPYRIEVEDTVDHSRAQMIMERLQQLGYKPQLLASREGDQTSYRINVGGFASEDAAEAAQDELHRRYDAAVGAERPATITSSSLRPTERFTTPANRAVNKMVPTPNASAPSQIVSAYAPDKSVGIEFSSEPETPGKINPKAYGSASYYNRGNAFFAANNLNAASAQFQKAVDLDPTNADAYYAWGLTLYAKRDLAGSIGKFRRATSLKPNYANAYYNWGLALYDLGETRDAISKFEKTVKLQPDYADAYYNWGLALSRTADLDRAINKFQQATNLNPKYADAYYGWGVALYHQQRFEESIAKYHRALELNPANQTYKMALASALTAQQNSSTAPQK